MLNWRRPPLFDSWGAPSSDKAVILPVLVALLGVGFGLLVATDGRLAVASLGLAYSVGLLFSARLRLVTVLVGSLLTLQSSSSFGLAKAAFAALVLAAVAGAAISLASPDARDWRNRSASLVASGALLGLLIVLSLPIALSYGTPLQSWLRDAAPYVLLAATPLLAIDAARAFSQRTLATALLLAGGLGGVSFMLIWIARRGLAVPLVERLTFPSFLLATAAFCYAVACAFFADRNRVPWLIAAAGLFSALMVTATRSTLILLIAPLLAPIVSGRRLRNVSRAMIYAPILVFAAVVMSYALLSVLNLDVDAAVNRLSTVTRMLSSPTLDASGEERVAQTSAAWRVFEEHPVGGMGLGHEFVWTPRGSLTAKRGFGIDTSVAYLAKFGLLGLIGGIPFVVIAIITCVRRYPGEDTSASRVAAILYFAVVLVLSLLGPPFEDKGFDLALIIILAMRLGSRLTTPPSLLGSR